MQTASVDTESETAVARESIPADGSFPEEPLHPVEATEDIESTAESPEIFDTSQNAFKYIDIDSISSNPYQPRHVFAADGLDELAASIAENGVLQAITVRCVPDGYQLIAGERRLRAAKQAGLLLIPAMIIAASDAETAIISLVENLQREDLNVIEEARCYADIIDRFGMTQEQLARSLGRSQSGVANKLRLLRLPSEIQDALSAAQLSERHARAILRFPDAIQQLDAMEIILQHSLSVRQCEEWVQSELEKMREFDAEAQGRHRERIRRFIPKDMLLFFNEFKSVVQTMQKAGIAAEYEQQEEDDYWEVTVRIKKKA